MNEEIKQKRVIHFASGETLEQDSCDEEENVSNSELCQAPVDTAQLSWRAYSWFLGLQVIKKSLRSCDYLGEKLANLVGLNAAKYQYAIDEYHRGKKKGSRHADTDNELHMEGAERLHLSSQMNTEYGATSSQRDASQLASSLPTEHRTTGSENKGYRKDEQQSHPISTYISLKHND